MVFKRITYVCLTFWLDFLISPSIIRGPHAPVLKLLPVPEEADSQQPPISVSARTGRAGAPAAVSRHSPTERRVAADAVGPSRPPHRGQRRPWLSLDETDGLGR